MRTAAILSGMFLLAMLAGAMFVLAMAHFVTAFKASFAEAAGQETRCPQCGERLRSWHTFGTVKAFIPVYDVLRANTIGGAGTVLMLRARVMRETLLESLTGKRRQA